MKTCTSCPVSPSSPLWESVVCCVSYISGTAPTDIPQQSAHTAKSKQTLDKHIFSEEKQYSGQLLPQRLNLLNTLSRHKSGNASIYTIKLER